MATNFYLVGTACDFLENSFIAVKVMPVLVNV
jgi:hypothetical protein